MLKLTVFFTFKAIPCTFNRTATIEQFPLQEAIIKGVSLFCTLDRLSLNRVNFIKLIVLICLFDCSVRINWTVRDHDLVVGVALVTLVVLINLIALSTSHFSFLVVRDVIT